MAARERKNYTLDPAVIALLDKVGNASEYLNSLVQQRWQQWTNALSTVRALGWSGNEVLAVCDVLNGYWMLGAGAGSPQAIALEMRDASELGVVGDDPGGKAKPRGMPKWDINPQRWNELVSAVRESHELTQALLVLVQEFWAGNQACEAAIRRLQRED